MQQRWVEGNKNDTDGSVYSEGATIPLIEIKHHVYYLIEHYN